MHDFPEVRLRDPQSLKARDPMGLKEGAADAYREREEVSPPACGPIV